MARHSTLLTPCLNADGPAPAASSSAPVLGSDQTTTRQPGCLYPLIRGTFNDLTGHVVFFSPHLAMVATSRPVKS